MLTLWAPSADTLTVLLRSEQNADFTYPYVGRTREEIPAPPGFTPDHNRTQLGTGATSFERAKAALRGWRMFPSWARVTPAAAPLRAGQTVAIVARVLGLCWTNTARIVYTLDEPRRFGFGYGTLPGHVECGEERFLIEWDTEDRVWYDLRAFSRPRHWLARLGYPATRWTQRTFARDSLRQMQRAVGEQ